MKKILLSLFIFVLTNKSFAQVQTCIDSSLIRPFCPCPMIYAPVCACNGIVYSNDCLAQCDGNTNWGPINPNLRPGDSCSLIQPPPPCKVEINGDSVTCNFPSMLYASHSSSSLPLVNYKWFNQINPTQILSTNQYLSINSIGTYCVSAEDSMGCIDNNCFKISVGELKIFTNPSPPNLCLGDSITLELKNSYTNCNWSNGKQTNIIKESPFTTTKYFVEALDSAGCINVGDITVNIDSCSISSFHQIENEFMVFPNPSDGNVIVSHLGGIKFNLKAYDISGRIIFEEHDISEVQSLSFSRGFYVLEISHEKNKYFKNIIVR